MSKQAVGRNRKSIAVRDSTTQISMSTTLFFTREIVTRANLLALAGVKFQSFH